LGRRDRRLLRLLSGRTRRLRPHGLRRASPAGSSPAESGLLLRSRPGGHPMQIAGSILSEGELAELQSYG
jgi:hypothetical protein